MPKCFCYTSQHRCQTRRQYTSSCIFVSMVRRIRRFNRSRIHRREPAASTTTSSSLSERRVINAPTMFLPCNSRRVAGSFCMRLDTATHAHFRSEGSTLSNYKWRCQYVNDQECRRKSGSACRKFIAVHYSTHPHGYHRFT